MIGRRRRTPDVAGRIAALEQAISVGGPRLAPDAVAHARAVIDRTGERIRLGADHTVVALAGATGSGKSTLFNALTGLELAQAGPRRPTTGQPMACVWGSDGADDLLDWLQVPRRHRTERESVLDGDQESRLHGLVLLDLPDHDSTVMAHRNEVDRLIGLVDLLVWVVDPQKYADEALHSGYLRGLNGHEGVMLVVLNQIDRLTGPDEAQACLTDLRRLLDSDGLTGVQVLATSARNGVGVDDLRSVLADVVHRQSAVVDRVTVDLEDAAALLGKGVGDSEPDPEMLPGSEELIEALSGSAGLAVVVDAVHADYLAQGRAAVGWPFARWARRLRPDALSRLRLGRAEAEVRAVSRPSQAAPARSQGSRIELAVRAVTAAAADGLPSLWAHAVRSAAVDPDVDLADSLDAAVEEVDLTLNRPAWWWIVNAIQILLAAALVAGLIWLAVIGVLGWLKPASVTTPRVGPVAVPTLLAIGGFLAGLVVAAAALAAVRVGARRRRAEVASQMRLAVAQVAWYRVVAPVSEVLNDHRVVRDALVSA